MSIQSVMNKRLKSFYESLPTFEIVTKELSTAKDPVLSHIPPSFRYETAAVQFTAADSTTIMFKEVAGTHCLHAPPVLSTLGNAVASNNSTQNTNWINENPILHHTQGKISYIESAGYHSKYFMHNSQTAGNVDSGLMSSISSMISKNEREVSSVKKFEHLAYENTHAINNISPPLFNAIGLGCKNAAFRILPHTIKYRNGKHIPYNSTYIGLPIGTTFTVRNRDNKKDWITYKIVGKLINFEETPRPLTQAQVQAYTCTDPNKYLPTDTYDKQLTNHFVVKPIGMSNKGAASSPRGLRWSAAAVINSIPYKNNKSEPIYDANGFLTMNRQFIAEWLERPYTTSGEPHNDTVVIEGLEPSNKSSNSNLRMKKIIELQLEYNEVNIIPDTLDLFIDGNPAGDHVVYSVDRTTIDIPAVDFTETNTYKNITTLAKHIPNYICKLIFDSPSNCILDEDVYNFFY